jgi:hypothetical protein
MSVDVLPAFHGKMKLQLHHCSTKLNAVILVMVNGHIFRRLLGQIEIITELVKRAYFCSPSSF